MSRRSEWLDRVARWRASRLTASEFAESEGVRGGTLRHWAWRLSKEKREGQQVAQAPAFVEFVAPGPGRVDGLEIVLRNEVRIRVPEGFDEATLRRLLSALETQ